jgi:hypothetical protein
MTVDREHGTGTPGLLVNINIYKKRSVRLWVSGV